MKGCEVMYRSYYGRCIGRCKIHKTVRIDKSTLEIIESVAPGKSFSEQLRLLVHEYHFMKSGQKCVTKSLQ